MFRSIIDTLRGVRRPMALVAILAATVMLAGGCSKGDGKPGADGHDDHHHPHGAHPTVGPHGGQIIEWGDHEYHVEITFERDKQQATVYILDHDVKKPEPVVVSTPMIKLEGQNKAIPLTPSPLDGETGGKSSRYIATDAAFAAAEKLSGVVSGIVDETPYLGLFKEGDAKKPDEHDEHDDHDDHDGHGEHDEHDEHGKHEPSGDPENHKDHAEGHGEHESDRDEGHKEGHDKDAHEGDDKDQGHEPHAHEGDDDDGHDKDEHDKDGHDKDGHDDDHAKPAAPKGDNAPTDDAPNATNA